MANERCGTCRNLSKGLGGGCFYSESAETPIQPHRDSECVFIKSDGKSRWEADPDRLEREGRGKLVVGYETDPAPRVGEYRMPTPEPDGKYSYVSREGLGLFAVDGDGNMYNGETLEPLGTHISSLDPKVYTDEEMSASIKEMQESMLKQLTDWMED